VLPVNRSDTDAFSLERSESLAALRAMVDAYKPAVLIIDPFREAHGQAENDADEMGPLLRPLRSLAHDTDTSIVLVHHMNKNGTFRGSTAIRAACDSEWAFARSDFGDLDTTEVRGVLRVQGRQGPRQSLGIQLGEQFHWQCSLESMGPPPTARMRILETLEEEDAEFTAQEIAHLVGSDPKTVQNIMSQEVTAESPVIVRIGAGRKNDPWRYRLAGTD
jgi:hypothetical protein